MADEQIVSDIRRQFFQAEYGQIHARIAGVATDKKPPLICLHMAPQSGHDFEVFMEVASIDRLVIAPDYYGYGDSDPLPVDIPATIELYAQAMWRVLDLLDIQMIEILGHHTGSKVAIEMALQRPNNVRKLTCIALSTMTPEEYANSSPNFLDLSEASMGPGFVKWWEMLKAYYSPDMPEDKLKQKHTISVKSGAAFGSGFAASHAYNAQVLSKLKTLKIPVTLINPNDDLRDITPYAAQYIDDCILIEKPSWLPGYLELVPKDVLAMID